MDFNRVLSCALDIGEHMLVSGAEVYRVEDCIRRICFAYGATDVDVFTITSSIVATVEPPGEQRLTQTRRIEYYATDLDRVDRLNHLSRQMCRDRMEYEEFQKRFGEIMAIRRYPQWIEAISYFIVASSFTVFFGGSWRDAVISGLIGLILKGTVYLIQAVRFNHVLSNLIAAFVLSCLAFLSVRWGLADTVDMIVIGNIMLLIPGIAMTNAVHDMFVDDMLSGVSRFFRSLVIAFLVAFGFTLAGTGTGSNMLIHPVLQTLMGALGSLGFAMVFRVRGRLLIFAFLGGLLSWGTYCIAGLFVGHEALQYLIATTVLTLYSEAFARILRCPSTIMLVTGWIPLIPGGSLYYSIRYLVQGNMMAFVDKILHTFLLMIAMSAGMLIAMTLVHFITPLRPHRKPLQKV